MAKIRVELDTEEDQEIIALILRLLELLEKSTHSREGWSYMDSFEIVQFIQRTIKERKTIVLDVLENNGIKSIEQYRELMGELNALNYILQELSGLLEKQEQLDDWSCSKGRKSVR